MCCVTNSFWCNVSGQYLPTIFNTINILLFMIYYVQSSGGIFNEICLGYTSKLCIICGIRIMRSSCRWFDIIFTSTFSSSRGLKLIDLGRADIVYSGSGIWYQPTLSYVTILTIYMEAILCIKLIGYRFGQPIFSKSKEKEMQLFPLPMACL